MAEALFYIQHSVNVDDGLGTASSSEAAIQILGDARSSLGKRNIRLHKILSSDKEVLHHFLTLKLASDMVSSWEICINHTPIHKALGVHWDED